MRKRREILRFKVVTELQSLEQQLKLDAYVYITSVLMVVLVAAGKLEPTAAKGSATRPTLVRDLSAPAAQSSIAFGMSQDEVTPQELVC
jgi:hypothetical protein